MYTIVEREPEINRVFLEHIVETSPSGISYIVGRRYRPVYTVINSRGRVLINCDALERAVDFMVWHTKSHKRAHIYG